MGNVINEYIGLSENIKTVEDRNRFVLALTKLLDNQGIAGYDLKSIDRDLGNGFMEMLRQRCGERFFTDEASVVNFLKGFSSMIGKAVIFHCSIAIEPDESAVNLIYSSIRKLNPGYLFLLDVRKDAAMCGGIRLEIRGHFIDKSADDLIDNFYQTHEADSIYNFKAK